MIRIAHYDDRELDLSKVEASLLLKCKHNGIEEKDVKVVGYTKHDTLIADIKKPNFNFDYLILDIFDETGYNIAKDLLAIIDSVGISPKTILFSNGVSTTGDYPQTDNNKTKYNFLLVDGFVHKDKLADMSSIIVNDYLENNIELQFDYINKDDILLKAEVNSIGEKIISLIIRKIKLKKNIKTPILIERMSSGFSGASVFKLRFDNKLSVLKVSKDKSELDKEMDNARKFYKKLPHTFRIDIDQKEDYSFKEVGAYLIENVQDGDTLFKLLGNNEKEKITEFLSNLFIEGNCMQLFYKQNCIRKDKYTLINEKFNDIKYSKVKLAFTELESLLLNNEIKSSLLGYIKNNEYDRIRPEDIHDENNVVVCHGDFHSRNIMTSNGDPVIIDTGGMKEDFWCMDICRLITNLFIEGFDDGTKKFYDINETSNQLDLAKKIINLEQLDYDTVNDGFILAINWLITNLNSIYSDSFCKWEFQLGLLKEFLQVSYRKNTIPPNKRALALLSAYECLASANKTFE